MSGLQLTHTLQNGSKLLKATIIVIVFTLLLNGCSIDWWVGDGRGDWTLNLQGGYAISKINSNEILLVHKNNPNDSGGTIVIPKYFVVAYQLYESYICLAGIRTQKISASEDELRETVLAYYLVETTNGEVVGPLKSYDELADYCSTIGLEINDKWINIKE